MRRLLHNESHADVAYDRPNLPWVCGKAAEGCPCKEGPTASGRCPRVDPDERCRPTHTLRVRRGRIAAAAALFAVGAALMLLGSPLRTEVLAPGALTQAHARLLTAASGDNRCAACHPGGIDAVLGAAPADQVHTTQSMLCVECHKSLIEPQLALQAHGLPPSALQQRGGGKAADLVMKAGIADGLEGLFGAEQHGKGLACATCHQEHHGADHNLSFLSNGRCQACHQEQYTSFADDHPSFGLWPYRRRTRINFDHNAHATQHYAKAGEAFACVSCHLEGPGGDTKLLAGYDQACARCHDEGIAASLAGGVPVFSLPTLDTQAMRDSGVRIDAWPDAATGDFDGELSAIAKLLVAADPEANRVLQELGADFSFFDLDPNSVDDARSAAVLAKSLVETLTGLAANGHAELLDRTARLNVKAGAVSTDLAGGLPVTAVDAALAGWFGAGGGAETRSATELAGRQSGGGWFFDGRGLALRYLPKGHADPLLRSWIELAASLGDEHAGLRDAVLAELAGAKSAGQCATCHSWEAGGDGGLVVNWRALDASRQPRGFTKFSHRPHVTQPELADCTYCHRLDPTASRQPAPYASDRVDDFVAQWRPVDKASCVACHQPKAAGESCTQCHHYHIEPPPEFSTVEAIGAGIRVDAAGQNRDTSPGR